MTDLIDVRELRLEFQGWAAASPDKVYELISDVSAMSTLSPNLVSAQYDDSDGPWVGAWFTGLNRDDNHDQPWRTRSRITEANPATAFEWTVVGADTDATRWRYAFEAHDGGTLITESWQVLEVLPVMGTTREALLELRAHNAIGMTTTLKAVAEVFHGSRQAGRTVRPAPTSPAGSSLPGLVTQTSTEGPEGAV